MLMLGRFPNGIDAHGSYVVLPWLYLRIHQSLPTPLNFEGANFCAHH